MPQTVVRHEQEHLYAEQPHTAAGRELSVALLRLRRAEHVQETRALSASGLSNLDLRALRYLVQAHRDGRDLGPKDLIAMLDTSSANITNVVDRLVNKGYVERVSHPTDRRAHHLRATAAAIQHVDSAVGAHHAELVAVINQLDEEQAAAAASVISQFATALDELATRQLPM